MGSWGELRRAVVQHQYSERIKSHLLASFSMVEYVEGLEGDAKTGAEGLLLLYMEVLMGEIRLAYNVTRHSSFLDIASKMEEATEGIRRDRPSDVKRRITEAVTITTTCALEAAERLMSEGLL